MYPNFKIHHPRKNKRLSVRRVLGSRPRNDVRTCLFALTATMRDAAWEAPDSELLHMETGVCDAETGDLCHKRSSRWP